MSESVLMNSIIFCSVVDDINYIFIARETGKMLLQVWERLTRDRAALSVIYLSVVLLLQVLCSWIY